MSNIYVFDLDGTLVDSMPYYSKGILSIADDAGLSYDDSLLKILTPLGYTKSAEYYVNVLGINEPVEDLIKKIETSYHTDLEYLQLACEEQEFLKTASEEDLDYYVQSGTGEGMYMSVSGILMTKPELAKQVPQLDIKRYQPIVR